MSERNYVDEIALLTTKEEWTSYIKELTPVEVIEMTNQLGHVIDEVMRAFQPMLASIADAIAGVIDTLHSSVVDLEAVNRAIGEQRSKDGAA